MTTLSRIGLVSKRNSYVFNCCIIVGYKYVLSVLQGLDYERVTKIMHVHCLNSDDLSFNFNFFHVKYIG